MITGLIFLIIIFSLVLVKSADQVVVAIRRIAKETHAGIFVVSSIILAVSTSFPELFVGITSALEKESDLALGVVLGSNIANIALVGASAAFIIGRVNINSNYIKQDVLIAFIAGLLPFTLIMIDRNLTRIDGIILITTYLAYATGFFKHRYEQIGREHQEESFVYRFFRKIKNIESVKSRELGRFFLGISILLLSADIIVKLSKSLALYANIDVFIIGLIVLAIGTSLPEFAFSIRSLEDGQPSMFLGNILGSVIANSTLIVGISVLIYPLNNIVFSDYFVAVFVFVITFITFWFFIKTKHELMRWEAGLLIIIYIIFLILEFTK
ncbi:hypothetical protein A2955_04300 [Candidatus Woesebacteria bacterium RIFCSPLOWO2_01_FULL_37_19]|uniref:Sodium/calcium exchanger membrane region domain-containing protein n=2 Tax=Candidatus Woeseibacteriota TaxID=1752722 RepID=A0A1F8AZS8_9BACT|nr:MAG: hypothetical protein A2771_00080 [Candidatus Woesebacteria bacterium RIFCSPHIGHO2_01_FULL_38_26b]OGM57274.1 MAG: hypothetical protein A2955_04300 [Candidatus Woesebacteria bacterium RIFCSPLOWO2_01_FULL_37_19]